jgi:UDP-glucose 4-epimerase
MKVLVTGGAGFIGSHVVDTLVGFNYEVVVIDDLSTGSKSNLNPQAKFYETDIRSREVRNIFEQEQFDFVIHHAAQMDVRRSLAEPLFDADVNIFGTLKLIELAKEFKIKRFVHISSAAVYGEPRRLPCNELDPEFPLCQYGVSKHTIEHYLHVYHVNYGIEYTVFRYPNVFGARQNPKGEAGVIAIFTGKMLANEPIEIHGDGSQTRDFVHVDDIAYANYLAVKVSHSSGIYNLGSGIPTSVNDIYTELASLTNYQLPVTFTSPILGETLHIHMDISKVRRCLGWERALDLHAGLKLTVAYLQNKDKV